MICIKWPKLEKFTFVFCFALFFNYLIHYLPTLKQRIGSLILIATITFAITSIQIKKKVK